MSQAKLELLDPEVVTDLWPHLAPMLEEACKSNEISAGEVNSTDLFLAAQKGDIGIIAVLEGGLPTIAVAVQFVEIFGKQGVEIIAMGGRDLMRARAVYWPGLLDWFRHEGLTFVDAYANERMAAIYKKKFGFTKSCQHVRLTL